MSARVDQRLELGVRERSWLIQRAADRRRWPSPQARARAFLLLAEDCIVRERARARIDPALVDGEFVSLVAMAERLAEGLPFYAVVDGEVIKLSGDIADGSDPRLRLFKRLLQLSGVRRFDFDELADRIDILLRREQRSRERGLKLLDVYMRGLPRPRKHAAPRTTQQSQRKRVPYYDDQPLRSIEEWLRSHPTARDQLGAIAEDDDIDAIGGAILADLDDDYIRRLAEGRFDGEE